MMQLPQILDGLGRGRLEVVQKAFSLHLKVFRLEFLKHLAGGYSTQADEHVSKMVILFETILNHSKKCDMNPTFGQSLLNLSVDHIKVLQQELDSLKLPANSTSIQQKRAVLELLNFHLNHFESLIRKVMMSPESISAIGKITTTAHVHSSSISNVLMNNLSSKSDEDVVRYALLSADAVDCAQKILLSRGERNTAQVNEFFQSVADIYINELLLKKQLDKAKDVIRNSDRDIWTTLKDLCLSTIDSNVRDYLALELNSISLLESLEIDAWKFLILIEGVIKNVPLGIRITNGSPRTVKPLDSGNQLELSISDLISLSSSAKVSLLTEIYFETFNGTLEPMLDRDNCWRYLLANDRLEIIIKWINAVCSKANCEFEKTDRVTTFLSCWDISQEMIDHIFESIFSPATKECVLDFLSRFGLFSSEESCNVHKRLYRAIHTSQIFNGMDANIEKLLVEFCIEYNMPDLLVSLDVDTNCQTTNWLRLYSQYQALKNLHSVKKSLCVCIEHSADYLKIPKSAEQWISLAPFLLSDQTSHDTLEKDLGVLQAILSHNQSFSSLLTNKTDENIKLMDVSLQQLLIQKFSSGSSHQPLQKQSLCRMFKEESDESEIDFSHEPSILLHGYHESLDCQYFLRQGRPCHAAMLVLSEVIRYFGKPSRKWFKRAILSAHELAFLNITDETVTSSCIAFIEMLGESSLSLRTHVATMKQIMLDGALDSNHSKDIPYHLIAEGGSSNPQEVFELLLNSLHLDVHVQGLAVQFANLHKLPLHTNFLEHCARNNDWINFLLFSQIYNYPPVVVKRAVKHFRSVALVEHFESFLQRYVAAAGTGFKPNSESPRLRGSHRRSTSEAPSAKDQDQAAATPSEGVPLVVSCAKDSVFGVLLACHNCADPVEALLQACVEIPCPVLAVLADFYQAKAEAQLAAWLASWLSQEERENLEYLQKNAPLPPDVIESIILLSLETSCSNLHTGLKMFLPEHPLVLILETVEEFSNRELTHNVQSLIMFKELSLQLETDVNSSRVSSWCLNSATFVLNIGAKILFKSLQCLPSVKAKKDFLQILCEAHIPFSPEDASVDRSEKLLAILNVLSGKGVHVDENNYFKNSTDEILRLTGKLVSLGLYKEAACISDQTFIISEQTDKFKNWLDTNYQDFRTFCIDCNSCFEEAMVDPPSAFNYFIVCASSIKRNADRWRALHYALKWLKCAISSPPYNISSAQVDEIELEMWNCCIHENDPTIFDVLLEELEPSALSAVCSKEPGTSSFTFTEVFHQCDRSCEDEPCPSKLITFLLDIGSMASARRVHNFYQSNHQDLEILETCVSLAEEKLKVQEIPTHWVLFPALKFEDTSNQEYSGVSCNGLDKELSISSGSMRSPPTAKLKVLSAIQELCKHLSHGKEIGKQLIACYRLAIHLDLSYNDVIAITDPLKLLRTAMSQAYSANHSVASDVMIALRMSPAQRAKFLSGEIISAISKGPAPAPGNVRLPVFLLWSQDVEQYFPHLLELVPDPSLLGNELMNMTCKLAFSDKNTPKAVLSTAAELLVRAHDCYAAGCHMEGISQVLRTISSFAPILEARSEWALMVRLLTGIQRYTDMTYIFKALKDNDHFEFLLRKDSIKPLAFKLALLDWLRRECPHDTALLKMTAAHFQMHQQEATLWQKEGNDRLSSIVAHCLMNNQKTKQGLQTAMQDYCHASECFLQADMMNHAMTCAHQAELVALQIHLLSAHLDGSTLRVIMLDSKSVAKLIVSSLSFNQALIVARAYNHRTDWAAALFYHCISPGLSAEEYFSAWSSCMELTPSIVQNIAYRLQRTTGITREMTSNMQWLLGHVQDMDVRYKIASELGLKDMVESLLQAPEVAYLKDTVWQSGFKR